MDVGQHMNDHFLYLSLWFFSLEYNALKVYFYDVIFNAAILPIKSLFHF